MTGAVLALVADSALRSLILGAAVLLLLKLLRLRDCGAETAVWTAVLLAALAMPALTLALPGLRLPLPQVASAARTAAPAAGGPDTLARAGTLAFWVYGLGVLAFLARLALGLGLTARLYLEAQPVDQPWAKGLKVRTSAAIAGPVSFGGSILLPEDCWRWPRRTLSAVLAHEEAHVRRGDFFIGLLASFNRALFWFNPFAWWLLRRLGALAERASDRAAALKIEDSVGYAEILLQVSRRARSRTGTRRWTGLASGPAMARGPGVARRIDEVLAAAPELALAAPARQAVLAGVILATLLLAALRATPPAAAAAAAATPVAERAGYVEAVGRLAGGEPAPRRRHVRAAQAEAPSRQARSSPAVRAQAETRRYDPRALVEDPQAATVPALLATESGRVVLVPDLSAGAVRGD